ncbi:transcriptional regulator [Woeseia oceani]|uniref:Transcriptional regulator n=2 Tax=Woeseia oceani TaxID=1548547 RepID=A0A193LDS4_9GAMM|nr:transcriptional regulator [Woeseia oceani]
MDIDTMRENAGRASSLLGAMANEKRLLILCQLFERECSVGELAEALEVRPSTVSQHLALLRKDGFVNPRRDAQTLYYSLAGDEARAVLNTLHSLYCEPQPAEQ